MRRVYLKSLFDNVETKGRRTDIDILKGIGILTVIYYHFGTAGMLSDYFSSFHMLLFFGVSGYCYKVNSLLCSPKCYIIKKIKAFIRPYLLWVSIYTFINFAMDFRSHSLQGVGVVFVCGVTGGICAIMNGSVVLSRLELGKSITLFYFSAFLSIFAWYSISVSISKQKLQCFSSVFSFLGRNTIYILITHQIVIRIVSIICARILSGVPSVLIGFFIVTILEITICCLCETKILKWMF